MSSTADDSWSKSALPVELLDFMLRRLHFQSLRDDYGYLDQHARETMLRGCMNFVCNFVCTTTSCGGAKTWQACSLGKAIIVGLSIPSEASVALLVPVKQSSQEGGVLVLSGRWQKC